MKALGSILLSVLAVSIAATARADDDVEACATASEKGQELRDQGKLTSARELFVTCAAERCPKIVRKDCADWLAAVDEALPSVTLRARDADGRDLTDVKVTVDGKPLADRLDGRAITLDPGSHKFLFHAAIGDVTKTLLLHEREKGRAVDVTLGAPKEAEKRGFSAPVTGLVLGGVSLAAFGAMAGFGWSAKSAVDDMRATCEGHCDRSRVEAAQRDMILANAALGAGVVALGAAVVVTIVSNSRPSAKTAEDTTVRVQATTNGISVSGVF
ncbi:MAG: hypothetical protein U0441_18230 [Polyangiaceae bacterium]